MTINHTTSTVTITYFGGRKHTFQPDRARRFQKGVEYGTFVVEFGDTRSKLIFRTTYWPKDTVEHLMREMKEAAAAFEQHRDGGEGVIKL